MAQPSPTNAGMNISWRFPRMENKVREKNSRSFNTEKQNAEAHSTTSILHERIKIRIWKTYTRPV
jgi:hypothetical protein